MNYTYIVVLTTLCMYTNKVNTAMKAEPIAIKSSSSGQLNNKKIQKAEQSTISEQAAEAIDYADYLKDSQAQFEISEQGQIRSNQRQQKKLENQQRAAVPKIQRRLTKGLAISVPKIENRQVTISEFGADGFPTNQAIKKLIMEQYFPKNIETKISVSAVNTGSFSDKIYKVSKDIETPLAHGRNLIDEQPVFFLKISNLEGSAQKLVQVQQSQVGRLGTQKFTDLQGNKIPAQELPVMSWVENLFTYQETPWFGPAKKTTIEVSHAAQGKSAHEILFGSENQNESRQCLSKIGRSLGFFQQSFMKNQELSSNPALWTTATHNDLNLANVFFDTKTSKTYFIDNEAMQPNGTITTDVTNLLAFTTRSLQSIAQTKKQFWAHGKEETIAYYDAIWLLQGYIDSFPEQHRANIAQLIKTQNRIRPVHDATHPLPIYYSPKIQNLVGKFLDDTYGTASNSFKRQSPGLPTEPVTPHSITDALSANTITTEAKRMKIS